MVMCRSIWSIAKINFLRWKNDHRIWVIFAFVGILLVQKLKSLTVYGIDANVKCTGFLLPVLFHGGIMSIDFMKTMLYLACLLLMCDAPFIYQSTPYIVLRSRRECWWIGECLYILLTTLLFTVFITVVSTAVVLPVVTFGESWGDALQGFAYGNAEMHARELLGYYGYTMGIPYNTMGYLYPSGAQLYTFLTVWISFFILGLLQYIISLGSKSMFLGFVAAGTFVFLDPILNSISVSVHFKWVQALSPVCWVSTDFLKLVDGTKFLTIPYIVVMFGVLTVLLLVAIRIMSKKIMIEVRGEV